MKNNDPKQSNYVIQIICEGQNTESYFFDSLRDDIHNGKYIVELPFNNKHKTVHISLKPEPKTDTEEKIVAGSKRGRYEGKARKSKNIPEDVSIPEPIKGAPPLSWVKEGVKDLEDGIDEVWTVFDKDGHPKAKEAFELAQQKVNGKNVNIAFTSICFEYYLLLHFEKLYQTFEKSECNEKEYTGYGKSRDSKTNLFYCVTANAVKGKACAGDKCVNGYARSKQYWTQTKSTESTYHLVKDKLLTGILNAVWLRQKSDNTEPGTVLYERNPYTTLDSLISRLTGYWYLLKDKEIEIISGTDHLLVIRQPDGKIALFNSGDISIAIKKDSFTVLSSTQPAEVLTKTLLLPPGGKILINELDYSNNELLYMFTYGEKHIIFRNDL